MFAKYAIDPQRWPKLAACVTRVLDLPGSWRTRIRRSVVSYPIDQHRDALLAVGAPITADTYGTATPRRAF
jgi:hypothetical protein